MTAVAPPLTSFQPNPRLGWSPNGSGFGVMTSDEASKMFSPGARKTVQRQNSNSSIASTASSTSTVSATSLQHAGGSVQAPPSDTSNWATRKKPTRGIWPPSKAEPATGLSTARPQTMNSAATGPTASSAISALHAPLLSSQQMANGNGQGMSGLRDQTQALPSASLYLIPMNGTFERKTISVPYAPEVLRIGRQTNQKTIPTPLNGYFDSKVLSRQHAEIYADRSGRVFIRDVKSSNGTFVNGMRLSQENKESEPRELREQDILELGIDIVSEDQKTVVHHKVAAKVERAGVLQQPTDDLNFGDLDPSAGPGLVAGPHQLKRAGSQGSINGRGVGNATTGQGAVNMGALGQPQHMRNWLNPITTEHIVRKLNNEMKLAMQQSQEIARARMAIESMLSGKLDSPFEDVKPSLDKVKTSPTKSRLDLKSQFSDPPAPPPQAPLPEKPDVARALADPAIQPLLKRNDLTHSPSANASPTKIDHSSDILRLCEELKRTKGELSDQSEKMRNLEVELAQERTARESAEERARGLEQIGRRDSPTDRHRSVDDAATLEDCDPQADLQIQLDRLRISMDDMKLQVESYRRRAESAEVQRDEARQSLADMVEQKRKELAEQSVQPLRAPVKTPRSTGKAQTPSRAFATPETNGHLVNPTKTASPTSEALLERAGIEKGQPITEEQAQRMTQLLAQEVLGPLPSAHTGLASNTLLYYGIPYGSFAAVILLGYITMSWVNDWPKTDR